MNNDEAWLRRMAEKEDGKIVSVGGWVHDIEKAEAEAREPVPGETGETQDAARPKRKAAKAFSDRAKRGWATRRLKKQWEQRP